MRVHELLRRKPRRNCSGDVYMAKGATLGATNICLLPKSNAEPWGLQFEFPEWLPKSLLEDLSCIESLEGVCQKRLTGASVTEPDIYEQAPPR